jgi:hypothetical protein
MNPLEESASIRSVNLAAFIRLLECGNWTSAAAAADCLSIDDRSIRHLAHHSGGKIGSGPCGYKLVTKMTEEEFTRFRLSLLSQAHQMEHRVHECDTIRSAIKTPAEATISA